MNIKLVSRPVLLLVLPFLGLGVCSPAYSRDEPPITKAQLNAVAASPCGASLTYLINQYTSNPVVKGSSLFIIV